MNPEKWEDLLDLVEEKFGIDDHHTENFVVEETHDGKQIMGEKEVLEFNGPLGKTRVERTSQPKLVDKKVMASKRIGSKSVIDYVYSPTEKSEHIKFYRWDETTGQWTEIKNLI